MTEEKDKLDKLDPTPKEDIQREKLDPQLEEMLTAGLHFGHRKTRQSPKMKPYIFGIRGNVSIIDLEQTKQKLEEFLEFFKKQSAEGKIILFIDTRPSTKTLTKGVAEELGMPYMVERWPGGTITNWKTIVERIEYFKNLENKKNSDEWEKLTKKEKHDTEQELKKLSLTWGGIKNLTNPPDVIFVIDMKENFAAIKEARSKGIKVVAIADSNADPELADCFVPANDDALSSVSYILEKVKNAILEGRK